MFKDIVVEVNGQEIPLHLCFTTHGTFVSIKNCYSKCYVGYDYDEMIDDYIDYLRSVAKSLNR